MMTLRGSKLFLTQEDTAKAVEAWFRSTVVGSKDQPIRLREHQMIEVKHTRSGSVITFIEAEAAE